jgi:hypothetical protein
MFALLGEFGESEMKTVLGPILGVLLIASIPASAQPAAADKTRALDPNSLALAHQIISVAFPPDKRVQMYNSMMDSIIVQSRQSMESLPLAKDKDFQALIDRTTKRMLDQLKATIIASIPDIFESMSRAYARDFSTDDLNAILAFVKTPAGQHYFDRLPLIVQDPDVKAATQRAMAQLLAKQPELDRENKRDIEDYIARKEKEEAAAKPKPVT